LPAGLEALRRRSVADAADGVPAHLTLLYPFVAPDRLRPAVRDLLADVAKAHAAFEYELVGAAQWPDTVYVAVDPERSFVALQADLARAFPGFPIYGRGADFEFIPHVTVAEGAAIDHAGAVADPAWSSLPRRARARGLEVIAADDTGRWRVVWRIPLGGRSSVARR
jgi:2'-5' RNA ligase